MNYNNQDKLTKKDFSTGLYYMLPLDVDRDSLKEMNRKYFSDGAQKIRDEFNSISLDDLEFSSVEETCDIQSDSDECVLEKKDYITFPFDRMRGGVEDFSFSDYGSTVFPNDIHVSLVQSQIYGEIELEKENVVMERSYEIAIIEAGEMSQVEFRIDPAFVKRYEVNEKYDGFVSSSCHDIKIIVGKKCPNYKIHLFVSRPGKIFGSVAEVFQMKSSRYIGESAINCSRVRLILDLETIDRMLNKEYSIQQYRESYMSKNGVVPYSLYMIVVREEGFENRALKYEYDHNVKYSWFLRKKQGKEKVRQHLKYGSRQPVFKVKFDDESYERVSGMFISDKGPEIPIFGNSDDDELFDYLNNKKNIENGCDQNLRKLTQGRYGPDFDSEVPFRSDPRVVLGNEKESLSSFLPFVPGGNGLWSPVMFDQFSKLLNKKNSCQLPKVEIQDCGVWNSIVNGELKPHDLSDIKIGDEENEWLLDNDLV